MKTFADAKQEPMVVPMQGAQRRLLSYGGKLMLAEFTFEGNIVLPTHAHPHEQIGYVVSGEVDFTIEGQETKRLTAGCSYYVPPNVKHGVVTRSACVLVDVFSPLREDFLP